MKKIPDENLPLSDDPEENKRIENELLQLKLKAELGVEAHIGANITSSIENTFLKNMLAFEKGLAEAEKTNIYGIIGKPNFIPESDLDDACIHVALHKITDLLNENQISLEFLGTYDDRTKYKFITEELFEEKVMNMQLPGMIMHFIYEEFHPNHKLDIEHKALKFIQYWFSQEKEQISFSLADALVSSDGKIWRKEKVMERINTIFKSFPLFKNGKYEIADVNFEIQEDVGFAYAEGLMNYTALNENQYRIVFDGPFKLYFTLEYEWWSIYYFVIPGFEFENA